MHDDDGHATLIWYPVLHQYITIRSSHLMRFQGKSVHFDQLWLQIATQFHGIKKYIVCTDHETLTELI